MEVEDGSRNGNNMGRCSIIHDNHDSIKEARQTLVGLRFRLALLKIALKRIIFLGNYSWNGLKLETKIKVKQLLARKAALPVEEQGVSFKWHKQTMRLRKLREVRTL